MLLSLVRGAVVALAFVIAHQQTLSIKIIKTSHANFGLDIRARINCSWMLTIPFILPCFALSSPFPREESLRYSRSKVHIGWLVAFRILRQIKKASSYDVFREGTVYGGAKKDGL